MPVEIKELIIRASVRDSNEDFNDNSSSKTTSETNAAMEENIVSKCVEQIMEILKIQNER